MSIFRGFRASERDDSSDEETVEDSLFLRRSRMNIGFEEYKHLRKAEPAARALPRTLKWVATLPPDVQPTALLRHYPRIANVIAATWEHSTSLRSYMDCLFSDNRGNRQGFPPQVVDELLALKRYYDSRKDGPANG